MSDICAKCCLQVNAGTSVDSIKCGKCGDTFHLKCSGLDPTSKVSRRTTFRCGKCTATPVNSDTEDTGTGANANILKAIKDLRDGFNDTLDSKLAKMENKITEKLDNRLTSIDQAITNLSQSFDVALESLKTENKALKDECDVLNGKVTNLSKHVEELASQMQDMQQYSRLHNIEVAGIPLTPQENVYAVLEAVAKALGIHWTREDICIAHRLPSKNSRHPSIVVRFVSRSTRATWLAAAKAKKNLDAVHLSSTFKPGPIFLNEHLTGYLKSLLGEAKKMVRDKQLAYAWVKEGKILVKATTDARARRVRSFDDLEAVANHLRSPNNQTAGNQHR